jgi:hypothetical protein
MGDDNGNFICFCMGFAVGGVFMVALTWALEHVGIV